MMGRVQTAGGICSEHKAVQRELIERHPGEQERPHELTQVFITRAKETLR